MAKTRRFPPLHQSVSQMVGDMAQVTIRH